MSTELKPIKVYGAGGPNPPKVGFICEELNLPYEVVDIPITDVKKPHYLAVNPNGRLPSIYDPNTDTTLWESGAILEYLTDYYDKEHKVSFAPGTKDYYLARQWMYFQVSGQGPYYGQAYFFSKFHPEKVPSAIERYVKEINRVTGVLEAHLASQESNTNRGDGPWFVGGKLSYVDLAFVTWQLIARRMTTKEQYNEDDYPRVSEWLEKLLARPSVKVALGEKQSGGFK